MKKQLLIMLMCLFTLATYAKKETTAVTFNVPLDCQNCVKKVESNIGFEKGVKALECDIAKQTVKVTFRPDKTNVEALKKGFAKIGYEDVSIVKEKKAEEADKACCQDSQTPKE